MTGDPTVLRDIHGLDAIPWLPLAPGWWFVIVAAGLLLLLFAALYWLPRHTVWFGWRADARRQLRLLKKALKTEDPQAIAGRLSELLRRIAVVHGGRQKTAGLTGDDWLQWLAARDNSGFDWERHGQMLLTAPYMPPSMSVERRQLARLINAARRWIIMSATTNKKSGSGVRGAKHV
jgi:hypothetical protein